MRMGNANYEQLAVIISLNLKQMAVREKSDE
jgi:hypothetical protein